MFRKLLALALVIVALHVAAVLTLGTSSAGSLIGNLLQITACGLAVAAVFSASRRAAGLSRRFWLLVGCGLAVWGVANLGWMYYEIALRMEPPTGSVVRFLFGIQSIFFARAVFLNQDKDSSTLDLESVLDFVQITIVLFFIFIGFYYIPSHHLDARTAYIREMWMESGEDLALVLLAAVQATRARSSQIRELYQGFAVYLLAYTVCAGVADYVQTIKVLPTGTWYDLGWTMPLLGAALWAASAAKKIWRAAARQRHTGAGAADRTAAGSAIRDGMARGAVHAAGRFDCVLRRAIGGHAIPAEPDRGYAATPQSGHGLRGERNRDCGRERTTHLRERGIRANGGARECGVHRRPAVEGCLRTPGRRASGRGDPRINAEEGQVVWADDYSPARRERVASGDGGYAFAGRRRGVRQPGHDGQAGGRKRARASGGEIPHAGRASGGHQLHRGAGHSRRVALCQPAGGNDVWIFGGRVADGLAGVDAARASGRPQDRGGRGGSEPARGAFSGGVSRGPQGWAGDLGQRYRGGGGRERRASFDGRNHRRYHGTQATGDATAASAAHGGHRQAGGRNRARLQQSADDHQGLYGAGAEAAEDFGGAAGRRGTHRGCLGARRHPGAAIAGVQPAAGVATEADRLEQHRAGIG